MFEKFLNSSECMEVLSWFISHPDGEYLASVVCMDCGNMLLGKFMSALSVLQGVELLSVNEFEEELTVSLNKESSTTKLLLHLKDEFNDLAFKEPTVSSALNYFYSDDFRRAVDNDVLSQTVDWEEVLDMCEHYEDIDTSNPFNKQIYDICTELEKSGELENFIKHTRNQFDVEK